MIGAYALPLDQISIKLLQTKSNVTTVLFSFLTSTSCPPKSSNMVLKLYGYHQSTCTRRAAVVLQEKQVPYEFILVDMAKGEHKDPEYLKNQPFGQVPYLDDDGFIIFESRAIAEYVALKYPNQGTPLVPTDFKKLALSKQAQSVEVSSFNPYAERAVLEMVIKPTLGGVGDKALSDELLATLDKKLDVYDEILGKQKYLAGDEITLADLFHLPYASMLPLAGSNLMDRKPNVARWYKDISSRPSWLAVRDGIKSTA
ncbi:hypothetical protein D9619_003957 [Psilocybe cf. subviscida]|uniref:glutathione transferase n=1 Tax=Psilocybe cf. subviscida TaxID=2480587 RepID=A0A8H5BPV8_9AGAR|nr:hypothetical protein D9619_003957 [Psilocybe cf. subviscida]